MKKNGEMCRLSRWIPIKRFLILAPALCFAARVQSEEPANRVYQNELVRINNPQPLLNEFPEFVQPIMEEQRYEAPAIVTDENADLDVRAWRFSYNARGIIEMPNHLLAAHTAIICVHPWGIDDSHGWVTPEPAGVADFCTPAKNHLAGAHTRQVIDPLLKRLRPQVSLVMYSLRGRELPVQAKVYRSIRRKPSEAERSEGRREMQAILTGFAYRGEALPKQLSLSAASPVKDYFRQFPGLDASAKYDHEGFWNLPIPVSDAISMGDDDYVYYDEEGYAPLREFLKQKTCATCCWLAMPRICASA